MGGRWTRLWQPMRRRAREWAAEIYRRLDAVYGTPDWRPYYAPVDELVLTILSQNTNDVNSLRAFAGPESALSHLAGGA